MTKAYPQGCQAVRNALRRITEIRRVLEARGAIGKPPECNLLPNPDGSWREVPDDGDPHFWGPIRGGTEAEALAGEARFIWWGLELLGKLNSILDKKLAGAVGMSQGIRLLIQHERELAPHAYNQTIAACKDELGLWLDRLHDVVRQELRHRLDDGRIGGAQGREAARMLAAAARSTLEARSTSGNVFPISRN